MSSVTFPSCLLLLHPTDFGVCRPHRTVPEVIAARHAGLRVLALSLVTNIVVWSPYRSAELAVDAESSSTEEGKGKEGNVENWKEETANHEEVLQVGREKAAVVVRLVKEVVASVP